MSIILRNVTASPIFISDTGVNLLVGSYTISPTNYPLWQASGDIVTYIGNSNVIVNDGSTNLNISDGTDLIKGNFPRRFGVLAGNDLTQIGHVGDRLKVDSFISNTTSLSVISAKANIYISTEYNIVSRSETFVTGTTYTVASEKMFYLTSFIASIDAPGPILYVRLKKQIGGSGAFTTISRVNIAAGGQGMQVAALDFSTPITIGSAGDVFQVTVDTTNAKGSLFVNFAGIEM